MKIEAYAPDDPAICDHDIWPYMMFLLIVAFILSSVIYYFGILIAWNSIMLITFTATTTVAFAWKLKIHLKQKYDDQAWRIGKSFDITDEDVELFMQNRTPLTSAIAEPSCEEYYRELALMGLHKLAKDPLCGEMDNHTIDIQIGAVSLSFWIANGEDARGLWRVQIEGQEPYLFKDRSDGKRVHYLSKEEKKFLERVRLYRLGKQAKEAIQIIINLDLVPEPTDLYLGHPEQQKRIREQLRRELPQDLHDYEVERLKRDHRDRFYSSMLQAQKRASAQMQAQQRGIGPGATRIIGLIGH